MCEKFDATIIVLPIRCKPHFNEQLKNPSSNKWLQE